MSKGTKIFLNIIYYAFTFFVGLFLAVSLPSILIYSGSMNDIKESLEGGNYQNAMMHIGGYFDNRYFYLNQDEDCGIVMFDAVTLVYSNDEDEEKQDETNVHKSYCGFMFSMNKVYATAGVLENNQTKIIVYDNDNNPHNYQLIDYDSDGNGEIDSIATQSQYDFIFFEIPIEVSSTVSKIEFIDYEGNVYKNITFETPLDFSEQFFSDVDAFVEEYNRDYQSSELERLDSEIRVNPNYIISSNNDIVKKVNRRVTLYVVLYFVAIYLIGDSLIGFRFVIKGIKWIIRKITKKEEKERIQEQEVLKDLYCMLHVKLKCEDGYEETVKFSFANSKESYDVELNSDNNYSESIRVNAGTYSDITIDIDPNYELVNEIEKINLTRFSEELEIEIKKKEEKRDEN